MLHLGARVDKKGTKNGLFSSSSEVKLSAGTYQELLSRPLESIMLFGREGDAVLKDSRMPIVYSKNTKSDIFHAST
jgi:hypothetical protein